MSYGSHGFISFAARSIRYRLNNLPLFQKILFIVLNNVFLIMVLSLFGLRLYTGAYNELLYKTTAGNLTHSAYTISDSLKSIENVSSTILAAPEIQISLSAIAELNDRAAWTNANRVIINSLQTYHSSVKDNGASFLMIQNEHFHNSTYTMWKSKLSEERLQEAIEVAEQKKGAVVWIPADPGSNALLMSREIRKVDNLSLKHLGTLVVYVDLNNIIRKANAAATQYSDSQYILCSKDQKIYVPEEFSDSLADKIISSSSEKYQTLKLDSHTYFTVHNTIPGYGLEYYSLVSYDEIIHTLHTSAAFILFILFAGVVLIVFISYCLIRSILKHFKILLKKMDKFSRDEAALLSTKYDSEYAYRKDEIGRLHQGFERMTARIQNLVNTNYVNEILAKEAQIKALESQINPHFLFNTLQTLDFKALEYTGQPTAMNQMIQALSDILKYSLQNPHSMVTLKDEIDYLKKYDSIQRCRYEDKYILYYEYEETLENLPIMRLILQPLIENSLYHGIKPLDDSGFIKLRIVRRKNHLIVSVIDTGVGMDRQAITALYKRIDNPDSDNIGLTNVNSRLVMKYGPEAHLKINSKKGMGTCISFRIPI